MGTIKRWEFWGMLIMNAIGVSMETELIPSTGTWHKLAVLAMQILSTLGFAAGKQLVRSASSGLPIPPKKRGNR